MALLVLTFCLLVIATYADHAVDKAIQNNSRGLKSVRCSCKSSKDKCENYYARNCSKCICGKKNTNTTPKCRAYQRAICSKCICGKKNTNTTPKCKAYQRATCSKCTCGKKNTNNTLKCKAYQKTTCSKCICGKKNTNTTPKCKVYQRTTCSKCVCGKGNTNTTSKCKDYIKKNCSHTPSPLPEKAPKLDIIDGFTIVSPSTITSNQAIRSSSGQGYLVMQSDGNLVLYHLGKIVWLTGTAGSGLYLSIQDDGNLVIYDPNYEVQWMSETSGQGQPPYILNILDDSVVLTYGDNTILWDNIIGEHANPDIVLSSGYMRSTFVLMSNQAVSSPSGRSFLVMGNNGNLALYNLNQMVWSTGTSGQNFHFDVQDDGNLVIYDQYNVVQWATETYNIGQGPFTLRINDQWITLEDTNGKVTWDSALIPDKLKLRRIHNIVANEASLIINAGFNIPNLQGPVYQPAGFQDCTTQYSGIPESRSLYVSNKEGTATASYVDQFSLTPVTTVNTTFEDEAYWAAEDIILPDNTIFVLGIGDFTIIAKNSITVGNNVQFAWQPSDLLTDPTQSAKGGSNSSDASPCDCPGNSITCGITAAQGGTGTPGISGFNGSSAPTVTVITKFVLGQAAFHLGGQKGQNGQVGGTGGNGGNGHKGCDATAACFGPFCATCKHNRGIGGDGGNGGTGGTGGNGGNGGNGGVLHVLAPSTDVLALLQAHTEGGSGGTGGQGGYAGNPGKGGIYGDNNVPLCAELNPNELSKRIGKNGQPGQAGPKGSDGVQGFTTEFSTVWKHTDPAEVDILYFSPRLADIRLNPTSPPLSHVTCGMSVILTGQNFQQDDILVFGSTSNSDIFTSVTSTFIDGQSIVFDVPPLPGPEVYLTMYRDVNGIKYSSLNDLSVFIAPILYYLYQDGRNTSNPTPYDTYAPEESATLVGCGMSNIQMFVYLDGLQYTTDSVSLDGRAATITLRRNSDNHDTSASGTLLSPPSSEANGEPVSIYVSHTTDVAPPSNTIEFSFDTYQILVLGDSVLWGQANYDSDKSWNILKNVVASTLTSYGVYTRVLAHSGSSVNGAADPGNKGNFFDDKSPQEIPANYPVSVIYQFETESVKLISNPSTVKLILINGCADEMYACVVGDKVCEQGLTTLGFSSKSQIDKSIHSCSQEIEKLIKEMKSKYYNARIFLTGYYTAFDPEGFNGIDKFISTVLNIFTYLTFDKSVVITPNSIPDLWKVIADNNIYFVNTVEKYFTSIVSNNAMSTLDPSFQQVFWVPNTFKPSNGYLGSSTLFIWSPTDSDPLQSFRNANCKSPWVKKDFDVFTCKNARVFHPNVAGQANYGQAFVNVFNEHQDVRRTQ